MKSEPKPFASLSSGLLARKGAARPAMRPQGFGQGGSGLEDLGWNDMGFEPPKPVLQPLRDEEHDAFGEEVTAAPLRNPIAALTPVHSPVHSQQAEIVGRFAVGSDEEPDAPGEEIDETAELYEPEEINSASDAATAETEQATFEPEPAAEPAKPVTRPAAPIAQARPAVARRSSRPRSAPGLKGKAAFTLRLDPDRHLKLRLACAVGGRSAQRLVTDALDQLLESMPELDAMAAKAKR